MISWSSALWVILVTSVAQAILLHEITFIYLHVILLLFYSVCLLYIISVTLTYAINIFSMYYSIMQMWKLWTQMGELLLHMLKMGDFKMSMIYLSTMVVQTWFLFPHLHFPADEVVCPRSPLKCLTNCLPASFSETFSAVIAASIIFIFSSRLELESFD